jgi:hypothetical protein
MSKLQKKPSALKREHSAFKNMKFLLKFLHFWVIYAILDPDPESEYGSGSNAHSVFNVVAVYLPLPFSRIFWAWLLQYGMQCPSLD